MEIVAAMFVATNFYLKNNFLFVFFSLLEPLVQFLQKHFKAKKIKNDHQKMLFVCMQIIILFRISKTNVWI